MKIIRICLIALGLLVAGCNVLETEVPSSVKEMEVTFNNLPQLPDSLQYVAWIAGPEGSYFYMLEKFTPVNGSFSKVYTDIKPGKIVGMQYMVVSIEKKDIADADLTSPSNVPIIAGYLNGNHANIKFSEDNAFPKLDGAKGSFILATPTDAGNTATTNGIWFVDIDSTNTIVKGLTLPTLPGGWYYQGWVEVGGKLYATGHFGDPAIADSSAPYSGSAEGYKFPGEDFLNNPPAGVTFPLDLKGAKVYITLQPKYDLLGSSYGLKILEGEVPIGAAPNTVYQLQQSTITVPVGTVKLTWQI